MALIQCNFFSDVLRLSTAMYVILPQQTVNQVGMKGISLYKKHPTLFLLHGGSDDYTIWLRRTSIERYVSKYDLAVIMPDVNWSYYCDMAHWKKYWTFISDELPTIARSFFPLSEKREDNFAAGLSMGGYGALKLGLTCPEKFAAVAGLSPVTDINYICKTRKAREDEYHTIFGDFDKISGSQNDLFSLAQKLSASKSEKPLMYQCCGTEDFLYEMNTRFRNYCKQLNLPITYEESHGSHEWEFWDKYIQKVLEWLPLKK